MARVPDKAGDPTRALFKAMAMDIGKEVAAYVETMYPEAVRAASSTFLLSLRNRICTEIMAAIDVNDEGQIISRMEQRRKWRRQHKAMWKKIHEGAVKPDERQPSQQQFDGLHHYLLHGTLNDQFTEAIRK